MQRCSAAKASKFVNVGIGYMHLRYNNQKEQTASFVVRPLLVQLLYQVDQCSELRTMSMRTKRSDPFGRCQSPVQQEGGKSWSVGDRPLVGPADGGKV